MQLTKERGRHLSLPPVVLPKAPFPTYEGHTTCMRKQFFFILCHRERERERERKELEGKG